MYTAQHWLGAYRLTKVTNPVGLSRPAGFCFLHFLVPFLLLLLSDFIAEAILMSVIQTKRITPADLLTMPEGKNYELVDGELVERNVMMS